MVAEQGFLMLQIDHFTSDHMVHVWDCHHIKTRHWIDFGHQTYLSLWSGSVAILLQVHGDGESRNNWIEV